MPQARRSLILGWLLTILVVLQGCSSVFRSPTRTPLPSPTPTFTPTPLPATPTPVAGGSLDPTEQLVIRLYERVSPAVVNITTRTLQYSFFGVVPEEGAGSGFVWDMDGHIVTNYHVVADAQDIEVGFGQDVTLPAQVVGVDPLNDLAVIKVERLPAGVSPITAGDSATLKVGQWAIAIGNPFGQFQRTLTVGVVSALDRTLSSEDGTVLRHLIQTDAAINRGNSGGPLLNSQGDLIGVNTAIFSPSGTSAGVGFAIPVDTVKKVVPVLIQEGRFPHPWLGAVGYSITPALAQRLGLPVSEGLLVAQLYRDSPAVAAGLRGAQRRVVIGNRLVLVGGDIILAIDGHPLKTWDELDAYLEEQTKIGQKVVLKILRDGKEMSLTVTLAERPANL
jgi:S1-C subfamily serine protease